MASMRVDSRCGRRIDSVLGTARRYVGGYSWARQTRYGGALLFNVMDDN
jgi:hypothetical protein